MKTGEVPTFVSHGRLHAEHPELGLLVLGSWGWQSAGFDPRELDRESGHETDQGAEDPQGVAEQARG